MKRQALFVITIFVLSIFFAQTTFASSGSIDPTENYSQFIHHLDPVTGNNALINWTPTNGTPVVVSDTAITGTIWSDTDGWINLNPTNGGVTNNCQGILGGTAWGQDLGWINFAPTNATIPPHINLSTGYITGEVWAQNGGYIELSSAQAGFTGLRTTWSGCSSSTPTPPVSTSSGGASGGGCATNLGYTWNPTTFTCTPPQIPPPAQPAISSTLSSQKSQSLSMVHGTLRYGMTGPDVKTLQQDLNSEGFTITQMGHETMYFGTKTRSAVKKLQSAYHLVSDGIVGPKTWAIITSLTH